MDNPPIAVDAPYDAVLAEIEDTHDIRRKVAESLVNLRKAQIQPVERGGIVKNTTICLSCG